MAKISSNPNFGLPSEKELYEVPEPLSFKMKTTWSLTESYTDEKSRPVIIWKNKAAINKVTRSSGKIVTEVEKAFAFKLGCNINDINNSCRCTEFHFKEPIRQIEKQQIAAPGMVIINFFKHLPWFS